MKTISGSINHLRILLISINILICQQSFSQHWMCDIKPGIKFVQSSFFKTKSTITNSSIITFDYRSYKQITKIHLEPELFMDFYKLNKKWHFGLGLTTYNWATKAELSSGRILNKDTALMETTTINLIAKHSQYMFTATRSFKINTALDKSINNNLILGIGVNRLYPGNTKTETVDFSPSDLDCPVIAQSQLYESRFSDYLSPVLLLKYEVSFLEKSSNKKIFNLVFSYIQGFSNANIIAMKSSHPSGASINVNTTTLGSGFRIGLSKTFCYEQKLVRQPTLE